MRKHPENLGPKFFYVESMLDIGILDSAFIPPYSDHYVYLERVQWGGIKFYMVRDFNLTILHRGSYKHCRNRFNRITGRTKTKLHPMPLDTIQ